MKKQKLINSFKLCIFVFGVTLFFNNCEANKDIIEESALEHQTPTVLSEKISFTQSKHFSEINSEIKSIQTKFNKKQTSKAEQKETDSLKILTDEVLYVTYAGTHTYTFKVVRKNPIYLLENIVLHYNLRTKSYDEYLMQYKDLREQDIKEISEGKLFKDSKKVIVTKLENGFFESYSSSNKASSTSKASSVICTTATSTVWVDCSQGVHHQGNIGEWYKCTAAVRPSAYQSTSTTCTVTSTSSPTQVQETADPSSGGGGNDPNVVIYNPLPLEPCDNSNEVDLNGNCIQPIDVAVSYIANCLSSNYSTKLSQSEINFLYSTTSSFDIKNYLKNNGCSTENKEFAKEIINLQMDIADLDSEIKLASFDPLDSPWLKKAREYAERIENLKDKAPDYIKEQLNKAIDNSFIYALNKTVLKINPEAYVQSDSYKDSQFKYNGKNAVGILLYEFANGLGADKRDFYFSDDITQQMIAGNVLNDIKNDFIAKIASNGLTYSQFVSQGNMMQGGYSFSPDHTTVSDSFNKHVNANWVQFFIGGASAEYRRTNESGWIEVVLLNPTSRNSLLLHKGDSYERNGSGNNKALSTIIQRFHFKLKVN